MCLPVCIKCMDIQYMGIMRVYIAVMRVVMISASGEHTEMEQTGHIHVCVSSFHHCSSFLHPCFCVFFYPHVYPFPLCSPPPCAAFKTFIHAFILFPSSHSGSLLPLPHGMLPLFIYFLSITALFASFPTHFTPPSIC